MKTTNTKSEDALKIRKGDLVTVKWPTAAWRLKNAADHADDEEDRKRRPFDDAGEPRLFGSHTSASVRPGDVMVVVKARTTLRVNYRKETGQTQLLHPTHGVVWCGRYRLEKLEE